METNIKLMVVLTKLNNAFLKSLGKNLEELNLQASMYTMLAHLNVVDKAKTQKLADVAVITSGTTTHIVNKLIKLGYVVNYKDPSDKRISWVSISEKGRSVFLEAHKKHMIYLDALLSNFTIEEKDEFIHQIKHFGKTIEMRNE